MPIPPSASGADLPREFGDVPPRTALDAARDELRADTRRGAGGRAALERYSARVDGIQPDSAAAAITISASKGGGGLARGAAFADLREWLSEFGAGCLKKTRRGGPLPAAAR